MAGDDGDVTIERVEINDGNAQLILKLGEVLGFLQGIGGQIAGAAASTSGGHFYVDTKAWPTRNAVYVTTGDYAAKEAEATDRTLTRSLDAGRK